MDTSAAVTHRKTQNTAFVDSNAGRTIAEFQSGTIGNLEVNIFFHKVMNMLNQQGSILDLLQPSSDCVGENMAMIACNSNCQIYA
jgi:hypothetical protein